MPPKGLPNSPEALDAVLPVSRETKERLAAYVGLLRKWQRAQNLVAPSALSEIWSRHVADSAQALAAVPQARRWVDLGSGAGFPGLVTAICLSPDPLARVTLIESNQGKAAFLRAVIRETGAPAEVIAERIEMVGGSWSEPVDAISARALAPLPKLLALAKPFLARGGVAVFHKGADFAQEYREAALAWDLDLIEQESATHPSGRIVVVRRAMPRLGAASR